MLEHSGHKDVMPIYPATLCLVVPHRATWWNFFQECFHLHSCNCCLVYNFSTFLSPGTLVHSSPRCLPKKSFSFQTDEKVIKFTGSTEARMVFYWPGHFSRWGTLSLPRMVRQSLHWAAALFLLILWLSASEAFLKGFDFVDAESPGRSCMVHGRTGVCMYSMVCTYAGGQHLGTCRWLQDKHLTKTPSPVQGSFHLRKLLPTSRAEQCQWVGREGEFPPSVSGALANTFLLALESVQ